MNFLAYLKTLFGMDPVLLDAKKRAERMEGTIDGDVDWMLVCKPRRRSDYNEKIDEIECDDGNNYYRKMRKDEG